MTLTQLRYLLAVDQYRHFGKAAQACNVSQPSLSIQIQNLEEELDVKLFERDKNICVPTEVGVEVLKQARLIADETQRMNDIVSSFKSEVKGLLKLGIIPTIAPFLLPAIIPVIQKEFPELRLEISEQNTANLVHLLDKGQIDAAILSTPKTAPESLKEKVLYYEPFVLFTSKIHPLSKVSPVSIEDLEQFAPFLLDDTHCMRDQVEKLCMLETKVESKLQLKAGSIQTLVEVVRTSGGYTLLPALAQEYFKKNYPDSFRPLAEPKPSRKVSLVFHRSFLKRALIDALHKIILKHLPQSAIPIEKKAITKVIDPQKSRFDTNS
jgi:LysR family transcriptional regulator, hydrogen peroxide-inducible genes activator